MKDIVLSPPKFVFIVVTRAALGIGLLVSRRLEDRRRRDLGRGLVAAGALSTIPAVLFLLRSRRR